ncbi:glycosyltransferase [Aureitalea sp. L0-47]|uniref:glycosyltransferase family 2 protein n=1 Tax=Aureitalea sp. L0-47 TaxID=2816962 RepID=UPI002237B565|nr:glycosyltransferase family 2 protein [Aureitalea sp. L0-47]MCW5519178.1 glycosyltransferase [Aureitalea sp. L0-47]
MKQPFLTIITINYNNRQGLEKTVRSVLGQTFKNYEYLIIDGASDDGSKDFLSQNEENFSFWVSEPDTGIFNAMNKGINHSSGEFLLFLNSGDTLNGSSALEEFIGHDDFKGDIIYGDYKFDKGGKVYADELTPLYFVRTSLPHQSTFFRKEVFETMGGYDESYRIISDRVFFVACFFSRKFEFNHIKYPLVHFDLEGVSNDAEFREQKLAEDKRMFDEFYGEHYDDYLRMLELERELNRAKRNTFSGILKRIKRKLS